MIRNLPIRCKTWNIPETPNYKLQQFDLAEFSNIILFALASIKYLGKAIFALLSQRCELRTIFNPQVVIPSGTICLYNFFTSDPFVLTVQFHSAINTHRIYGTKSY